MMIDAALRMRETSGRPIRVGLIGAGAAGRAIALQLGTPVAGIRLVAIANTTLQRGDVLSERPLTTGIMQIPQGGRNRQSATVLWYLRMIRCFGRSADQP
jgi:hypothetical protein